MVVYQKTEVRGQKDSYSLFVIGYWDHPGGTLRRVRAKTGIDLNRMWERLPAAINAAKGIVFGTQNEIFRIFQWLIKSPQLSH